jgi:NAD(P)-dependent dehydrogenase (short-subunit alcohol dehydrogenase family)
MTSVSMDGKVAIVTGAGRSLGRSHALDLTRHGAAVVVNDLSRDEADAVVREIEGLGGRAVASYGSVSDVDGARSIVDAAVSAFGTVDAVVCNAGTMRNGWFEELTPDDLQSQLDVHIKGCFFVTQAAWPIMREKGYGRVVLTSSSGGMWAMMCIANYAAAKAGVYGLGRALAFEGRAHGINVNVLLPGANSTIAGNTAGTAPVPDYDTYYRPELRQAIGPRRQAESVSPLVTYLCSEACTTTGETISSVAGRYARILVGITDGWFAQDHLQVTADDIAEHFGEICDPTHYSLPKSLFDQYEAIGPLLGVPPAAS